MATATEQKVMTKEELEGKRSALVLRRLELQELIGEAPPRIAQLRETWIRSESAAAERKLHNARKALTDAEEALVETDADLAIVEVLYSECLAAEAAARAAEVRAEADAAAGRQRDALASFGEWFAAGY